MPEVYYLLACYGLTFSVCDASIFARPRDWLCGKSKFIDDLLSCYFCAGFWVSLVTYIALFGETIKLSFRDVAWTSAHIFAGAAFCYMASIVVDFAEITTMERRMRFTEVVAERDADGA